MLVVKALQLAGPIWPRSVCRVTGRAGLRESAPVCAGFIGLIDARP
jgi:hypothetical protein